MALKFKKATRKRLRLRIAINGPTGSGKTYSALSIASHLAMPIALIDTEHGSASLYSDKFEFDTLELKNYRPGNYIEALHAAADAGYPVVIIDSLSHAWFGKGGILDQLDNHKGRNNFTAWKNLTPQQNALIEAILEYKGHIIVTMRSKMEYEVSKNERGKTTVEKLGLSPIQRAGLEYEFDIIIDMDQAVGTISKTRCSALHGGRYPEPGRQVAETLKAWLNDGGQEEPPHEPHEERRPAKPMRRPTPTDLSARRCEPGTYKAFKRDHGEPLKDCHQWQAAVCQEMLDTSGAIIKDKFDALHDRHKDDVRAAYKFRKARRDEALGDLEVALSGYADANDRLEALAHAADKAKLSEILVKDAEEPADLAAAFSVVQSPSKLRKLIEALPGAQVEASA